MMMMIFFSITSAFVIYSDVFARWRICLFRYVFCRNLAKRVIYTAVVNDGLHEPSVYRPVARIFYGWVRSVDYTDQRAPEALFTRGVRGHDPPGNFEN